MELIFKIVDVSRKYKQDKISLYAAQASFFIIVSFFPFLMLLLSLLQYTSIRESYLLSLVNDNLPLKIQPLIITLISEVYSSSSFTLTSITALSTIWASGRGFVSIIRGLNTIYEDNTKNHGYFTIRIRSILYTLALIIIICASLILIVFGNNLLNYINTFLPWLGILISYFLEFRLLIFIGALSLFFLIVYTYIPNHKNSLSQSLPGAVFSSLGWIIFSYAFYFYIEFSGSFSVIYGSLTALVIIMLWLYFCINILFIGAIINIISLDSPSEITRRY